MAAIAYTHRDDGPVLLVRGQSIVSRLQVYANGVATAYAGTTYTLTDASGNTVSTATATADGTATKAAPAGDPTTGLAYSTRWRESWAIVTGSEAVTIERDAWLVRSILRPVVTVDDLCKRHRDLRDIVDGGDESIRGYVDEAWSTINADLIAKGRRPNLIMESWALRKLHIFRALHLLFTDAATRFAGTDRYADLATDYEDRAEEEWGKGIRFEYDADEDGVGDGPAASVAVVSLTAGNMWGPMWR